MTSAHEQLERLTALHRQGLVTDAEFESRRAGLIDEAVAEPSPSPARPTQGRNIGHVLLGALGGLWLGVLFIAALLLFVPRARRADRLFGAWLGTATGLVAVLAVVAAATLSGAGATSPSRADVPVESPVAAVVPHHTAPEVLDAICRQASGWCPENTVGALLLGPNLTSDGRTWYVELLVPAAPDSLTAGRLCGRADDASLRFSATFDDPACEAAFQAAGKD